VPIFLDAMQPLALGLTHHNKISRLTLSQLQRVGYCDLCYFISFCLTLVPLGDFLHNSCFSDKFIGCRSNFVIFFHIFLTPPWFIMSCSLFENNLYSFDMTVLIHILCNVLSTIMVNSLAC
jgi:hypothetical protein